MHLFVNKHVPKEKSHHPRGLSEVKIFQKAKVTIKHVSSVVTTNPTLD